MIQRVEKKFGIASSVAILFGLLVLTTGCAKQIPVFPNILLPHADPTLDEILTRYPEKKESLPSLQGLIEVTLREKSRKRFWAKWNANKNGMKMEGFDFFGGPLFHFETSENRPQQEIIFTDLSSGAHFQGSREEFMKTAWAGTSQNIWMEWFTLLDDLTRFGLPNLSAVSEQASDVRHDKDAGVDTSSPVSLSTLSHHIALEKQEHQLILYAFSIDAHQKAQLDQKIFIEKTPLRVTEILHFDVSGAVKSRTAFLDYRPIDGAQAMEFPFLTTVTMGKDQFQGKIVFKELRAVP